MSLDPLQTAEEAAADIRKAVLLAFCQALHGTRLPPMTVMSLVAEAMGSIYREVAEVHGTPDGCPCGWTPSDELDVRRLQRALRDGALPKTVDPRAPSNLHRLRVVGSA